MPLQERRYHVGRFEVEAFGPTSLGTVVILHDAYTTGQVHVHIPGDAEAVLAALDKVARYVLLEMRRYDRDDVLDAINGVVLAYVDARKGKRRVADTMLDAYMRDYAPNPCYDINGRLQVWPAYA